MSETFFAELRIPAPDVNLCVGSGTPVMQTVEIMRRMEPELEQHRPDCVIVVGDVNSTVAAALAAAKLGIPVAHVEAGLRCFDHTMPEELNRIVTDSVSTWLFASEPAAAANLRREGVADERVHHVGNVMVDTLSAYLDCARAVGTPEKLGLTEQGYAVVTLHRPANVDDPQRLESILSALSRVSQQLPVVFAVHPRTRSRIRNYGFADRHDLSGFRTIEPQGYVPMLGLIDGARFVLTDSGGLQEETTALRVPCLTIRENTERRVTAESGSNRLVGWRRDAILEAVRDALEGPDRCGQVPELWDGQAAQRIVRVLVGDTPAPAGDGNRTGSTSRADR